MSVWPKPEIDRNTVFGTSIAFAMTGANLTSMYSQPYKNLAIMLTLTPELTQHQPKMLKRFLTLGYLTK